MAYNPTANDRRFKGRYGKTFEDFMAAAQLGSMRSGREKYWSRNLGYSSSDWDAEAGVFTKRASASRFRDSPYLGQSEGWKALTAEQQQQVVDAAQRQHAEELLTAKSAIKGETMLEGLKAKSETMEQLVANRRALRDAERKAERGLY
ncbi:MAG: hypothetical protein QF615_02600 [Planctomycetota bacterium]|nr:hypothetical protein [Planctomycetota bacterium]